MKQVGGRDEEIRVFRFDEIFSIYTDDELGEDYALIPEKLGEVINTNPAIIICVSRNILQKMFRD